MFIDILENGHIIFDDIPLNFGRRFIRSVKKDMFPDHIQKIKWHLEGHYVIFETFPHTHMYQVEMIAFTLNILLDAMQRMKVETYS